MSDSPPLNDGRAKNVRLAHAALLGAALIFSVWNVLAEKLLRAGTSAVAFSLARDAAAAAVLLAGARALERDGLAPAGPLRGSRARRREHGARVLALGLSMACFQVRAPEYILLRILRLLTNTSNDSY